MSHYVIGDVQGCFDELIALCKKIKFNPKKDLLIFAGDLVNRGPKSLDVIDFCLKNKKSVNINSKLGKNILYNYNLMEQSYTLAEYIWLGGNNEFRSKTRVFNTNIETLEQLPKWNYDGSSTEQADGDDT